MFLFILLIFSQFLKHIYHYLKFGLVYSSIFTLLGFVHGCLREFWYSTQRNIEKGVKPRRKEDDLPLEILTLEDTKRKRCEGSQEEENGSWEEEGKKRLWAMKSGSHWTGELGGVRTLPLPQTGLFQFFTSQPALGSSLGASLETGSFWFCLTLKCNPAEAGDSSLSVFSFSFTISLAAIEGERWGVGDKGGKVKPWFSKNSLAF